VVAPEPEFDRREGLHAGSVAVRPGGAPATIVGPRVIGPSWIVEVGIELPDRALGGGAITPPALVPLDPPEVILKGILVRDLPALDVLFEPGDGSTTSHLPTLGPEGLSPLLGGEPKRKKFEKMKIIILRESYFSNTKTKFLILF